MCIVCNSSQIDPNIVLLDCSGCKTVLALPESLLNLKFLVIYDTNIKIIPQYEALEGLYCMNCPIETIPDLPKLRKLNATNSKLTTIPDTLYRVETILINQTNIQEIPDTLISLRYLSVSNTRISVISHKLINIESLIISDTQITKIVPLMSLNYIDFSNTGITGLPLNELKVLRKVVAKGCSLTDPFSIIERGIDLTN
jgi:Leucine-rich repeat (LRR) protein